MQMISSKYTNFMRFVSVPLTLFLFGVAVIIIARMPDVSLGFKCAVAALWVWVCHYCWRIIRVLATVSVGEDYFLVTLGETSVFVPFRNILSVEQLRYTRLLGAVISIDLLEPTTLGTNIKFMPPTKITTEWGLNYLGHIHPMVDELRGLALRARCS